MTKHFNVRKFSGDADPQYQPKIDALAPLAYCSAKTAPLMLITGDRTLEFPCRVEENEFMAASMKKLVNTEVAFRELPCRTHVTVLGPSYAIIRDFIRSHCGAGVCIDEQPVARLKRRLAGEGPGGVWTIGCEVLDRELAVFREYKDYLPQLGIKRIRLQGGWARCEQEKGVYDFSWIDEPVDFCRTNNMEVLLETSYGNPIYEGAGGWDLGHDVHSSVFTIMEYAQENRPLNTKGLLAKTDDKKVKSVKTAFWAVANVASVFDKTVVRVKDAEVRMTGRRPAAYVYTAPGGRIVTFWDASRRPDETLHPQSGELTLSGAALKEPVLVDLITGEVFAVKPEFVSTANGVTTYRNLPVHDYPWLLAEKAALRLDRVRHH